ncbi:MAG: hypothetical protein LUH03_09435 [Oscillospiraceae bacterium]|nr:hypothetical protein [Oscillospiraceae bacterium]
MSDNVNFGNEVMNEAKADITDRTKKLTRMFINGVFDFLDEKVKDLPETIKQLRNNPEADERIAALWSEHLSAEGMLPKGYEGLPDELLVANLHQDGYLSGLSTGYILAMMSLVDNDAPKELILSVRDDMRSSLIGNHYDDRDDFAAQYKDDKYSWVEKNGSDSSASE